MANTRTISELEAEGYPWIGAECCKGTVWVPFKMIRERIPMLSAMTGEDALRPMRQAARALWVGKSHCRSRKYLATAVYRRGCNCQLIDKRFVEEGNEDHFILFIAGAINETKAIIRADCQP